MISWTETEECNKCHLATVLVFKANRKVADPDARYYSLKKTAWWKADDFEEHRGYRVEDQIDLKKCQVCGHDNS